MPRRKTDSAFARELGARLKAFRLRAGLSSPRVAELAGVSVSLVCEIERGRATPSVATLFALADALCFSVDALRRPLDQGLATELVTIASWRARAERAENALAAIEAVTTSWRTNCPPTTLPTPREKHARSAAGGSIRRGSAPGRP